MTRFSDEFRENEEVCECYITLLLGALQESLGPEVAIRAIEFHAAWCATLPFLDADARSLTTVKTRNRSSISFTTGIGRVCLQSR